MTTIRAKYVGVEFLTFREDEVSGGLYSMDQEGILMTREEFEKLVSNVSKFFDYHGDDKIAEHNRNILEEEERREDEASLKGYYNGRGKLNDDILGWLYCMHDGHGNYKVGITSRKPEDRAREVERTIPYAIEVIWSLQTKNLIRREWELHKHFRGKRVKGEWFNLNNDDIEWLKGLQSQ